MLADERWATKSWEDLLTHNTACCSMVVGSTKCCEEVTQTRRDYLVKLRLTRGWQQKDVAAQLGVTASFYGMIEQGVRTPRLSMALQMERLFGVPVHVLFAETSPDEPRDDDQAATSESA